MKKMKILTLVAVVTMSAALTGCTYTDETVEKDVDTVTLEAYEDGRTQITDEIEIKDEPFKLLCKYDTENYELSDWRVTSNKSINITVNTTSLPEGYTVHIEHVHADIVLKSTEPQIDGITQDSMDDSDHRVPTKGFPVSDTVAYHNTFAIEGYTEQFYSLWGYAFKEYGSFSSSYERLAESNIRKVGTYAEKLSVVYDIVISTPECEEGYVKSVYSEVLIPLVSEVKAIEKDFWTGEEVNEVTSQNE